MNLHAKIILVLSAIILPLMIHAHEENGHFKIPTPQQAATIFEDTKELLPHLSQADQQYYAAFTKQIKFNKQHLPDVTDPNTLKAYMAFYKLQKYGERKQPVPGRIDENWPLLGYSTMELNKLLSQKTHYKALRWLETAIYTKQRFRMIPASLDTQAEQLSWDIFYNTLTNRFPITKQQLEYFSEHSLSKSMPENKTYILDTDNQWNDWCLQILLNPHGIKDDLNFYPLGLIVMHELLHVQDQFPGDSAIYHQPLTELSTSLQDIMLSDLIYKEIKNIPLDQVVEYQTEGDLPFGEIAVFLHRLQKQYPHKNMTQLLVLPELQEYIQDLFDTYAPTDWQEPTVP